MNQGICLLSVAGMKAEPSHQSELVNQMVFGDLFEVIRKYKEWLWVRLIYDDYHGWINQNQATELSEEHFIQLKNAPFAVTADLVQIMEDTNLKTSLTLGAGCTLHNFSAGNFSVAGNTYKYFGNAREKSPPEPKQLTEHAIMFLNTPYQWGGRSPFGIDCSGFVQLIFKMAGIFIPRDTSMQVEYGEFIDLIHEALPGDLLFFGEQEKPITHVGMLLTDGLIIHAHGKVRVDLIDHHGIFDREFKKYTHSLRLIKRPKELTQAI
ncbi:MAG TPA: C40 family peptidase [Bacteroidales bacterium]|nr:C40 family peptidase [Bacteroidales bacterium]